MYLDCNYGVQDGPNKQRVEDVVALIAATKLPWIIIGDFNHSPDVIAESSWCRYLRGVVITLDVPFTCTHAGKEGGSMLDFVVCDRHLAPHIGLFPKYYGFKPDVVSARLVVNLAFEPDVGKNMVCPTELLPTIGPRLPQDDWSSHWLAAQAIEPDLQVPWDSTASIEATRLYARFGHAVES